MTPHRSDAYGKKPGARATADQVSAYIADRLGAVPVLGLTRVIDPGGSRLNGTRISGFMERHTPEEWLLPLSARRPLVWETDHVPEHNLEKIAFVFSAGFGNGSPLPQPSGRWDIRVNGRHTVSVRVVNHSQVWETDGCALAFAANRLECAPPYGSMTLSSVIRDEAFATFGPALLVIPAPWVPAGRCARISVHPVAEAESTRWFQLDRAPGVMMQADVYRAVELLSRQRRPKVGAYTVYFGDIHTHSGQVRDDCENSGCGMGSREENYAYARGAGGLDFYSLTDHEWQIDPDAAGDYFALADEYEDPGSFICLPGFEHTNLMYGHRNVYFRAAEEAILVNANRKGGRPTLRPEDSLPPRELWAALAEGGNPFMTVPHHTSAASHPCNLGVFNPQYDRLIEVYSVWGSSEYYGDFPRGVADRFPTLDIRDAIRRGHRFGMIASSDGHDGHPGNAQGPLAKHHHQFHFCGSGRAAVLAPELSRAAVFDALFQRRCYATTGAPIVLDFRINGTLPGLQLPRRSGGKVPAITVDCTGTNGIDHIRVIRNGCVVHTEPYHGEFKARLEWEDTGFDPDLPSSYYVRVVQVDRESAWSSPVWVG